MIARLGTNLSEIIPVNPNPEYQKAGAQDKEVHREDKWVDREVESRDRVGQSFKEDGGRNQEDPKRQVRDCECGF